MVEMTRTAHFKEKNNYIDFLAQSALAAIITYTDWLA